MYLAVPHRWTGGIKNARWNADPPISRGVSPDGVSAFVHREEFGQDQHVVLGRQCQHFWRSLNGLHVDVFIKQRIEGYEALGQLGNHDKVHPGADGKAAVQRNVRRAWMELKSRRLAGRRSGRWVAFVACLLLVGSLAVACSRKSKTPNVLAPQMADSFSFMQINPSKFRWATVMPFSVQNTSDRPVHIVAVHPSKLVNVKIGGFYMIGPRVPSLANAVLRGWPPVNGPPNISPLSDKSNQPSMPTLHEFHRVEGFIVHAKPKGKEAIAFGPHRLYSDLSNEATLVMKYRLEAGKRVGFVKGFTVEYRISGDRSRTLSVPESDGVMSPV